MKAVLLFLAALPSGAIAYYYLVSLPAHNRAVLDFEKQKYRDAQERADREALRQSAAADEHRQALEACLATIQVEYDKNLRMNGAGSHLSMPIEVFKALQHKRDQDRNDGYQRYR